MLLNEGLLLEDLWWACNLYIEVRIASLCPTRRLIEGLVMLIAEDPLWTIIILKPLVIKHHSFY